MTRLGAAGLLLALAACGRERPAITTSVNEGCRLELDDGKKTMILTPIASP